MAPPLPAIEFTDGRPTMELRAAETVIGSGPSCHVRIHGPGIADEHAQITVNEAGPWITDLGSLGGTKVNGQVAQGWTFLNEGDRIDVGSTSLIFHATPPRVAAPVVAAPVVAAAAVPAKAAEQSTMIATEAPREVQELIRKQQEAARLKAEAAASRSATGRAVEPAPQPAGGRTIEPGADRNQVRPAATPRANAPVGKAEPEPPNNRTVQMDAVEIQRQARPFRGTVMGLGSFKVEAPAATPAPQPAAAKPSAAAPRPAPQPAAPKPVAPVAARAGAPIPASTTLEMQPEVPSFLTGAQAPPATAAPSLSTPQAAHQGVGAAPITAYPPPAEEPGPAPVAAAAEAPAWAPTAPASDGGYGQSGGGGGYPQPGWGATPDSGAAAQPGWGAAADGGTPAQPGWGAAPDGGGYGAASTPMGGFGDYGAPADAYAQAGYSQGQATNQIAAAEPYVAPKKGPFGSISRAFDFYVQMFRLGMKERRLLTPLVYDLAITTGLSVLLCLIQFFISSAGGFYALMGVGTAMLYFVDYSCNSMTASLIYDQMTTGRASPQQAWPRVKKALPGVLIFASVQALLELFTTYLRERDDALSRILRRIILPILMKIWSTATYVVMPAMVLEGISFGQAFKRSKDLMAQDPTGVGAGVVALSLTTYVVGAVAFALAYFFASLGGYLHPAFGLFLFLIFFNLYFAVSGWLKIAYATLFYIWARECERAGQPNPALAPLPLRHAMDAG